MRSAGSARCRSRWCATGCETPSSPPSSPTGSTSARLCTWVGVRPRCNAPPCNGGRRSAPGKAVGATWAWRSTTTRAGRSPIAPNSTTSTPSATTTTTSRPASAGRSNPVPAPAVCCHLTTLITPPTAPARQRPAHQHDPTGSATTASPCRCRHRLAVQPQPARPRARQRPSTPARPQPQPAPSHRQAAQPQPARPTGAAPATTRPSTGAARSHNPPVDTSPGFRRSAIPLVAGAQISKRRDAQRGTPLGRSRRRSTFSAVRRRHGVDASSRRKPSRMNSGSGHQSSVSSRRKPSRS